MVELFILFFILGFITAANIAIVIYNVHKHKHSKAFIERPEKSNSDVAKEEDKHDNGNIYEMSKTLDILDEYLNGGENERGR